MPAAAAMTTAPAVTVRMPDDMRAELDRLAVASGLSVSDLIRTAVRRMLEAESTQVLVIPLAARRLTELDMTQLALSG